MLARYKRANQVSHERKERAGLADEMIERATISLEAVGVHCNAKILT
jgi:hypothetical protein